MEQNTDKYEIQTPAKKAQFLLMNEDTVIDLTKIMGITSVQFLNSTQNSENVIFFNLMGTGTTMSYSVKVDKSLTSSELEQEMMLVEGVRKNILKDWMEINTVNEKPILKGY